LAPSLAVPDRRVPALGARADHEGVHRTIVGSGYVAGNGIRSRIPDEVIAQTRPVHGRRRLEIAKGQQEKRVFAMPFTVDPLHRRSHFFGTERVIVLGFARRRCSAHQGEREQSEQRAHQTPR
jgi:hypothetical protein